MISPGAFSTSQFAIYLNEASASLGNLKKCLCSRSAKLKHQNKKLASVLNLLPSIDGCQEKVPIVNLENLPSDWLKTLNVPNSEWVDKTYPIWKTSYVSADSFLLNKHGWSLPFESRYSPLYTKRMTSKRRLFIQNIQRRSFFFKSKDRILHLEEMANSHINSPDAQAQYLSAILDEDPEYVIRRYESGRYASNEDVKDTYTKALIATGRLSISEALRRSSSDMGSVDQSFLNNLNLGNSQQGGSKTQPLYVVMQKEKSFIQNFNNIIRYIVIGALIFFMLSVPVKIAKQITGMNEKQFSPDVTDRNVKFDDVRGCDEVKEELQKVVEFLKQPEKFESLGAKLPAGVLLTGSPGTGKTLLARAIAGEADVPFFFASGSEFEEKYVGVGAARIRKLFESAKEHAPCIIFIDELDAIAGQRSTSNIQPYSRMTLNQLLVELDGFDQTLGIIIIGATNFPEILDQALTRPGRFDSKVHVPLPDVRGRADILRLYMEKSPCAEDVDPDVFARITIGFSGADLMNLVNQAALRAASLQLPLVNKEHFQWAFDKIIMGPERRNAVIPEQGKILTAYHEGGHAIVALYTKDARAVHKATIIPRGPALGYIMQLPHKNETSTSQKQLLAEIDVCMGGRVAEEMIFGEDSITTGASSDMMQASDIARSMVTQYGMSDKVGTVLINEKNDKISPELQNLIENEVKRIVEEAYIRAKDLLRKHSKEHKRLAEALLKYETLDAKEINLVIKGLPLENK